MPDADAIDKVPMERFAKVHDTPTTQVLAFVEYDPEEDNTVMHQIGYVDGAMFDVKFRWDGEDQRKKALAALEKYDMEAALRMVNNLTALAFHDEPTEPTEPTSPAPA